VVVARQAIQAWGEGKAGDDDAQWVNWLLQNRMLSNSRDSSPRLNELLTAYRAAEEQVSQPRVFYGMADLDEGYNFPLLPRGNAKTPGDPVPRGYLGLVTDWHGSFNVHGSGRRELADVIASAQNPLTSRVMVNRLWQHVFGRGIVGTTDDFGRFGAKPSHPELLDYLAANFVEQGWSIKKQLRELVVSKTFQQSSDYRESAAAIDPSNELVHHYPVRRLNAESVRDAILATSGRFDGAFYGPSIHPYRTEPKEYRKLYSGPLDGEGRRSLYLKVTRHEGSRFLETFDFPNPGVARGKRDVTNVPSQALTLLNDPFVIDQAGFWADRLLAEPAPSVEARLDEMFLTALGRRPQNEEQRRLRGLVDELASLRKVDPGDLLANRDLWKDVAHAMFNMKEFIYIR
jgi:hypothetical protein